MTGGGGGGGGPGRAQRGRSQGLGSAFRLARLGGPFPGCLPPRPGVGLALSGALGREVHTPPVGDPTGKTGGRRIPNDGNVRIEANGNGAESPAGLEVNSAKPMAGGGGPAGRGSLLA